MQILKERTGSGGVRDSCRECGEGKGVAILTCKHGHAPSLLRNTHAHTQYLFLAKSSPSPREQGSTLKQQEYLFTSNLPFPLPPLPPPSLTAACTHLSRWWVYLDPPPHHELLPCNMAGLHTHTTLMSCQPVH